MRSIGGDRHRRTGWLALPLLITSVFLCGCESDPSALLPSTQGGAAAATQAPAAVAVSHSASILEQLSLERINRARLRPAAEAAAFGIALDEGISGRLSTVPRQPLAMNSTLTKSARLHSQDMLDQNYFAHTNLDGLTPFDRMEEAGYVFQTAGENLAWRGTTGPVDEAQMVDREHTDLFVDTEVEGRGHRVTMLNGAFREVGVGIVRGTFQQDGIDYDSIMQTQDFGTSNDLNVFVLGVVYDDNNSNGLYDAGEGTSDSAVSLGNVTRITNDGGGYAFEVTQPGPYTLRFAGGRAQELTLTRGGPNLKVDLVDRTRIVVNLGAGPLP